MIAINLTGPYLACRASNPLATQGKSGDDCECCIRVGARPAATSFAYCGSKAGVTMFSKLSMELAPTIRVNVVRPGVIDTPMFAMRGRIPRPCSVF